MRTIAVCFVFAAFFLLGPASWPTGTAHAAGDKDVIQPDYEYLEMKPLVLPVITDQGVTQQVSLIVSIEVPFGKKAEVEFLEPRLADAYLQDLYGALAAGKGMGPNNVIDVQAVKKRLTNVTHKVLKEDQVNDVLLQVLQQRRMM